MKTILEKGTGMLGGLGGPGCTPGYYNNEGQPSQKSRQNSFFFGEPEEFVKLLEGWRADGGMKGLELS